MHESAPRNQELSPTAGHYLDIVEGLDQFSRNQYGIEIVDHNFTPDHERSLPLPSDLAGFKTQVDTLLEGIPNDEPNANALHRNLSSTRTVLDVLSGDLVIGKNIGYCDYVEGVMGVRPVLVPETIAEGGAGSLEGQRHEIEKIVEQLGYQYHLDFREAFNRDHAISTDHTRVIIESLVATAREHVAEIVEPALAQGMEEIDIRVVQEEDTWQGFFGTTKDKEFVIMINANPLLQISSLEELGVAVHELTHGISSANKKWMMVHEDNLNPALGALLCFSPAYFQEEVTARAVEASILADDPRPVAQYTYRKTKYVNDVWQNMMIRANTGWSEDEAAAYGAKWLPFEVPDKIKKDAEMLARKLLYKTVFAVDTEAIRVGRRIAAFPHDTRQAILTRLCSETLDTSSVIALGQPELTSPHL